MVRLFARLVVGSLLLAVGVSRARTQQKDQDHGKPEIIMRPAPPPGTTWDCPKLEKQMLDLLNKDRSKNKLAALAWDDELCKVARDHTMNMVNKNFFSHYNPEGKDPFDRMKTAGLKFRCAGENLAMHIGIVEAEQALMESPGHRANILEKDFGRCGIGIFVQKNGQFWITQVFRD